ncbi:MAG: NTP transferase domain-containing protein [Euryarchaeota archaeon]|nr:NTP transferase domain-containing protein [Euryarchaeota archaeon]
MKAVILAGGRGKRLRPFTEAVPKALLPVEGKAVILHQVEALRSAGVEEVLVVRGALGEKIERFLRRHGVDAGFVTQASPLGSAHALSLALPHLEGDFIALACDYVFPAEHLRELLRVHRTARPVATLSLKRMGREEIKEASTVLLEHGRVLRIVEKPREEEILSEIAAAPLYVFSEEARGFISGVELSPRGEYEIASAIQDMIDSGLEVRGVLTERWAHLSRWQDLLALNFPYLREFL